MAKLMPNMPKNKSLPSEGDEKSPLLEEAVQTIIKPGDSENVVSDVKVDLIPSNGIAVFATRNGFYGQRRYRAGDKFVVKSFNKLGTWMECEDTAIELKRLKFFKDKKARK